MERLMLAAIATMVLAIICMVAYTLLNLQRGTGLLMYP